jgi:hypothetical protein
MGPYYLNSVFKLEGYASMVGGFLSRGLGKRGEGKRVVHRA